MLRLHNTAQRDFARSRFCSENFSLVIPIYNEEALLVRVITTLMRRISGSAWLHGRSFEIILVENGSTDATHDLADSLARTFPCLRVLHIKYPSYGQAFREGIRAASFPYIVQFDLDFFDLGFLRTALTLLDTYDVVIGSKNLSESSDSRPFLRRMMSKILEICIRFRFGTSVSDTHGLKAFRKEKIIDLIDTVSCPNHFFDSELLILCEFLGYRIREIPVRVCEIRRSRFAFSVRAREVAREFLSLLFSIRKPHTEISHSPAVHQGRYVGKI